MSSSRPRAERGLMPTRCKPCARFEKSLKDLHESRINMWRRGVLTDDASERLAADERRIAEEMKRHHATAHGQSDVVLEAEIRRRAYELYEERGCRDGYDLDDWLRAEAEIRAKITITTAA